MAIKLQDWGMIPTPARQAVVRSEGIDALTHAHSRLGASVGKAIESTAPYGEMLDKINTAGDIADIARQVQDIVAETKDKLGSKDVPNWQYRWDKETAPRVKDMLAQYTPASREAGSQLAKAMTQRASIEAKQNTELSSVQDSENKWSERLGHAEQSGDEQLCDLWLKAGRGHFFAENDYEQKKSESLSRCKLNQWQNRLDTEPLATLADLEEADESSLPSGETEQKHFQLKRSKINQGVRAELGELFVQHIKEGMELEPQQLELAQRAKILSPLQFANAMASTPSRSKPYDFCRWMKNLDELDTSDEEQYTLTKLELGTTNIPIQDKQRLLKRLEQSQDVTLSDRRNLSRQIWGLYEQGYLGARADAPSLSRLRRLQEEGLAHIRDAGAEDTAQWIQSRKQKANSWICFTPQPYTKKEIS